jgi:hypothetical protein
MGRVFVVAVGFSVVAGTSRPFVGSFYTGGRGFHTWRREEEEDVEKMKKSNQPAAPNAGIAFRLAIEHHWPGVGEKV